MTHKLLSNLIFFLILISSAHCSDIFQAIDSGKVSTISKMIEQNPKILNTPNHDNLTPLNFAAYKGQTQIVAKLLELGADLTIGDNENSRPIHNAAAGGYIDIVDLLLSYGADLNIQDNNGYSPLMWATMRGHTELVKFFLSKGANIFLKDNYTRPAFHMALWNRNIEITKLFIEHGFNIDSVWSQSFRPIDWAIFRKDLPMVEMLIDEGANIHSKNTRGETYLHCAVFHNEIDIAELLIKSGIDVNSTKKGNLTPLHIAAIANYTDMTEMVNLLINYGAELDARSSDGGTPIHYARAAKNQVVRDLLIAKGAKELPRNFPKYSGKYLGAKPPGDEPEPFVPELFTDIYGTHSRLTFSPDGKEAYWQALIMRGINATSRVWFTKEVDGVWQAPQIADFSEYRSGGPVFFDHGNKLMYYSSRPHANSTNPNDLDLWLVEKTSEGWSKPIHLDTIINNENSNESYPHIADDGTIYLKRGRGGYRGESGYIQYKQTDGDYKEIGVIGDFFETDYVDLCEMMDLFLFSTDRRRERFHSELYVSFHQADGRWTTPVYLGDKLHQGKRIEFGWLSPDKNYLFITKDFCPYWIDAKIIDELRSENLNK